MSSSSKGRLSSWVQEKIPTNKSIRIQVLERGLQDMKLHDPSKYTVFLTDTGAWEPSKEHHWDKLFVLHEPEMEGGVRQDGLKIDEIITKLNGKSHKELEVVTSLSMLHRTDTQKLLTLFKDCITRLTLRDVTRSRPPDLFGVSPLALPTTCISPDAFFCRLQNLPNLTHLAFGSRDSLWCSIDNLAQCTLQISNLTSLKTLQLWNTYATTDDDPIVRYVVHKILNLAVNLEGIKWVPLIWSNVPFLQPKLGLVKSFVYNSRPLPANQENYNHFTKFMENQLRLQQLNISLIFLDNEDRMMMMQKWKLILNSILQSSQHSLKTLKMQSLEDLGFLHFPILTNLKSLIFTDQPMIQFIPMPSNSNVKPSTSKSKSRPKKIVKNVEVRKTLMKYFPVETCIDEIFPNVVALKISMDIPKEQAQLFQEFFPSSQFRAGSCFKNVKSLVLPKKIPIDEKIVALLPNLKSLELICDSSDSKNILRLALTHWTQLAKFDLYVQMDNKIKNQNWDEIIIGIPESRCQKLRNSPSSFFKGLEKYRKSPSIFNMQALRTFNIHLCNPRDLDKLPVLLTFVSRVYGFSQMPNLELFGATQIECKHAKRINKLINDVACQGCGSLSCCGFPCQKMG